MANRTYTFQNGQTADGGQVETEFNEIYTNITNDNIDSGAAIAISKTALGTYTPWDDWTPTLSASGSMTYTSTTITEARYMQLGKTVYFSIEFTGTIGGILSTDIRFTLPATPLRTTMGACYIDDGTGLIGRYFYSGGLVVVSKDGGGNWTAGSARLVRIQGFYEVA